MTPPTSEVASGRPGWLEPYLDLSSGTIGHLTTTGFLDWEIQAVFKPVRMVGIALTVSCPPTDNGPLSEALAGAESGTVLMVARHGDRRHAPWGGLMARMARGRGLAGTVIDGAATDLREVVELRYPVFARNLSALTTRRRGLPGSVGEPIVCGGVTVRTGDVVLGDDDGVVVVGIEDAPAMLAKAARFEQWEDAFRSGLEAGLEPKVARARADAEVPR